MKKKKEADEKPEKRQKKQEAASPGKKQKPEGYVMKKNTGLKALRIALWVMMGFVFFKGVLSCFQRDRADEASILIREFKASYSQFTGENEEVMSFAQNFVREYLTYAVRGEDDYKSRLKEYVADNFFNETTQEFTAAAEAVYVQAYRTEDYTEQQKDVYVLAEVEYTKRMLQAETGSYTEEISRSPLTLKVPVYCSNGTYTVESLPLVVSDSVWGSYAAEEYFGTSVEDADAARIETSVDNFLKAYCEQAESVIDYYLDPSADKADFAGLNGRFGYLGIRDIKCYQGAEDIICIVRFEVQDTGNDTKLLQKINLTIQKSGERYYIKEMNTRTGNLKLN